MALNFCSVTEIIRHAQQTAVKLYSVHNAISMFAVVDHFVRFVSCRSVCDTLVSGVC